MANRQRDADFTEYVQNRTAWLRRVAVLLCRDVYVIADVHQQYSQNLSENAVTQVTSFGTNPADWRFEDYAAA